MKFLLALILFLGPALAAAEDRWVDDSPDVVNFKIGTLQPSLQLSLRTKSGNDAGQFPVMYLPSPQSKTFMSFGYRNLGITVATKSRLSDGASEKYGNSDSLDLQLRFFGRKWTQQYFYQTYKGYYLYNTAEIDPAYPPNSFIQRRDIRTTHYGADFIYTFQQDRYSFGAALNQQGRQLESGGSWLAMVGMHNHRVGGDQDLIPSEVSVHYQDLAHFQSADIAQLSLAGGGAYTYPFWHNFYVSAQALIGFGYAYERFETAEAFYVKTVGGSISSAALSFGYNGPENYLIVSASVDSGTYDLRDLNLSMVTQNTSIHYGHRFGNMDLPWLNTVSGWLD
jgi:hypothetical protein